ncbi:uncharacterized protein LOC62_02G001818 [Vanrija pseudolonga]|uniref:Granulins domain-containing protein n=1 Tax=Vanrija pseudolonga TaxID=143232 RepID=A0AAF1BG68_9TREE|nr:hypothetical protein LOC62_02G001818 [Vanrija pseudolonga]
MKLLAPLALLTLVVALPAADEDHALRDFIASAATKRGLGPGRVCGIGSRFCCDGRVCTPSMQVCPPAEYCQYLPPCAAGVQTCCGGALCKPKGLPDMSEAWPKHAPTTTPHAMKLLVATIAVLAFASAAPVDEDHALREFFIRASPPGPKPNPPPGPFPPAPGCGPNQLACCDGKFCSSPSGQCPPSKWCNYFDQTPTCPPGVKMCCNGYCPPKNKQSMCPLPSECPGIHPPPSDR